MVTVTESGKHGWRSLTKAVMQSLTLIKFILLVSKMTMSMFLPCPEGHTDEWLAGYYINSLLFVSKNVYILVIEIRKYIWQSQYMHGSWSFQNTGKTKQNFTGNKILKNNPHPNGPFLKMKLHTNISIFHTYALSQSFRTTLKSCHT